MNAALKQDSFESSANPQCLSSQVVYSLTASVYNVKSLLASTVQTIEVLPTAESQPPMFTSDFGGEYFLSAESPRHRQESKDAPAQKIELAGQEPEPLALSVTSNDMHTAVKIPFVVKVIPATKQEILPSQCELTAHLVTRTFVTPNSRNKRMPTIDDLVDDEDAHISTIRTNAQAFTMAMPAWSHYSPGKWNSNPFSHEDRRIIDGADGFALTKFPFLFKLESERQLVPTFFTPILSRRYAIECKMSFPGYDRTLELSLPLQVVYSSDQVQADQQAPKYEK